MRRLRLQKRNPPTAAGIDTGTLMFIRRRERRKIRLSAKRRDDGYTYRIQYPGHEPFATSSETHAIEHLRALGVDAPEQFVEQARQWKEVEIHDDPPSGES